MKKSELFKEIYKLYAEGIDYLYRLPDETAESILENKYIESLELTIDLLMEQVFTEHERVYLDWFMFDWHNHHSIPLNIHGEAYVFNDVDKFINLLRDKAGWK